MARTVPGPAQVETHLVRRGRARSFVTVTLRQAGEVTLLASLVFVRGGRTGLGSVGSGGPPLHDVLGPEASFPLPIERLTGQFERRLLRRAPSPDVIAFAAGGASGGPLRWGDGLPGLAAGDSPSWLTLLWVLSLGMAATLPIGAALGSASASARSQQLLMLPILALLGISGIFYPVSALPGWIKDMAQVFPVYWMGLGMRSALLPSATATVEIGSALAACRDGGGTGGLGGGRPGAVAHGPTRVRIRSRGPPA